MSRAARSLRGLFGALSATVLAAASHALGGGTVTILAVMATALVALPLCVALAGRIGSLWRLTLAVGTAQVLYHWSFAGLGLGSATKTSATPLPAHAEHAAALARFVPDLVIAGSADTTMWIAHAGAAALTIALLHRGERAALALGNCFLRVWGRLRPRLITIVETPAPLPLLSRRVARPPAFVHVYAISHRGPPTFL